MNVERIRRIKENVLGTYRQLHSPAAISFEHAWFLLLALGWRDEIAIKRCAECGGVELRDLFAKRGSACATCEAAGMLGP